MDAMTCSFNENHCPLKLWAWETEKKRWEPDLMNTVGGQFEPQFANFCHDGYRSEIVRYLDGTALSSFPNAVVFSQFLPLPCQIMMRNIPPLSFLLFQDSQWTQFHDNSKDSHKNETVFAFFKAGLPFVHCFDCSFSEAK